MGANGVIDGAPGTACAGTGVKERVPYESGAEGVSVTRVHV
jgi:hypothetical protein